MGVVPVSEIQTGDNHRPGPRAAYEAAGEPEPIRQYGDPVLRSRARSIRKINAGIRGLSERMAEAMYAANGVGLAATQIGEARRVIVLDVGDGLTTLINPRLVSSEGSVLETEGCLSVRGLLGEVERAERVRVRAVGLDGKEITIDAEGLLARALQHELDHLDGVLFVDRARSIRDADEDPEEAAGGSLPADDAPAQSPTGDNPRGAGSPG